jgi:phenylalanine--tRNA ligase, beta subunit
MLVSRNFLNDYISLDDIKTIDLAEKLTELGLEYDYVTPLVVADNTVIAKIIEVKDHPDSDHLHLCKVDDGEKIYDIVCGAPNVRKDMKVILAKVGAKLKDIEIKESVIRGEKSEGMLCSLMELGIDKKFLSLAEQEGIHEVDENIKLGRDAKEALLLNDEIIDLEIPSNRGDLLSIYGIAKASRLIVKKDVKEIEDTYTETNENIKDYLTVSLESDNVSFYQVKLVKDIKIKESPLFIKNRLIASGVRPINNVVDISNYVMLETGQPLHFYDYEKINKNIIVREAKENEVVKTLDDKERQLNSSDIVIANDKEILAIAGIMGAKNSEVDNDTKDIVIESAIFKDVNIRNTSKRTVQSEASFRFEKNLIKENSILAIKRAGNLLEKYADAKIVKEEITFDKTDVKEKEVILKKEKISKLLGIKIEDEVIKNYFDLLDFKYVDNKDNYLINIPIYRQDIKIDVDIIEEIIRAYGINNLESKPIETYTIGGESQIDRKIRNLRHKLLNLGLDEVLTYTLVSSSNNLFNIENMPSISIKSPLSQDKSVLRTTLIPSLLDVYAYNKKRQVEDINIFEISNIYYKKEEVEEEKLLTILLSDDINYSNYKNIVIENSFYTIKGMVENIFDYLGFNNRYSFVNENIPEGFNPYQTVAVKLDRVVVGYFGMLHPDVTKDKIFVAELNLTKIFNNKVRGIKVKEISKYPSISIDLAFVVNKDVNYEDVKNSIKKACSRELINIELFDYYDGEKIEKDKKQLAFKLTFNSFNKTLEDSFIKEETEKVINRLKEDYNAYIRDK